MTLRCCQYHILIENIWFVWSKISYCGDKWRCYRCGTNEQQQRTSEDRANQHWLANGCWRLSFANSIGKLSITGGQTFPKLKKQLEKKKTFDNNEYKAGLCPRYISA